MVREEGRQTVCMNNQIQVGKAMLTYETAKQRLPGVLNNLSVGGATTVYNWAEALFPYMERADLWESLRTSGGTAMQRVRVKESFAPTIPIWSNPTAATARRC